MKIKIKEVKMNKFEFNMLRNKRTIEQKQKSFILIKKSVNYGANGTLVYVIKNGTNKGKVKTV